VRALLSTGELMLGSPKRNVELTQLLESVLLPFVGPEGASRIVFGGPPLILPEKTAGNLALAMHELATNAIKYGALKSARGKVDVAWSVEPSDDERRVQIDWRETGGEPIAGVPERNGFGSRVIGSALAGERDGTTEILFEHHGLHCRFRFTLAASG
jgi:two-component sensor histidine kinase